MTRQQQTIAMLCAVLLASACASPNQTTTQSSNSTHCGNQCESVQRRQSYIIQNPHLSPNIKTAILKGRVLIGMTKEEVVAAIGRPDQKQDTSTWAAREHWIYHTGTDLARLYIFQFGKVNSWRE